MKNHYCYPKQSAGRLLITNVPVTSPSAKISEVEKLLIDQIKNFETVNYVYVVDVSQKLVGVLSIKDIFRQPKNLKVRAVMSRKLIFAHPHTHQERVAYLALKNNLKSIPIVDKNNSFLGIMSSDTILNIVYDSASKQLLKLSHIQGQLEFTDDVLKLPISISLKHRLPWLIAGLLGGLVAAYVIGFFEPTLQKNLMLAAFIPLIVYMSGATSAQMIVFFIRDQTLNIKLPIFKYFLRQTTVVALLGLIISGLFFGVSFLIYKQLAISGILGIALFTAIFSSVITGLFIPYFFSQLKLDPANASGPIATIIQDILSIFIYFSIASILL